MPKRRHHGDGSIEELPSGKFRGIVSLGVVNGQRLKARFIHKDRPVVLQWLRAKQAERDRGHVTNDGGLTLAEWLVQWLQRHRLRVEVSTYDASASFVRVHLLKHPISAVRLASLRPAAVEQLYVDLSVRGVPAPTRRRVAITLSSALKAAVKLHLITSNPAREVDKPRYEQPEMRTWAAEEIRRFLAAIAHHRLSALFVLALDAGMRQGELLGLQWEDVDLDAGRVRVVHSLAEPTGAPHRLKRVKTRASRRLIALSPPTVAALRRHRQLMRAEGQDVDAGKVFCSQKGKWIWKSGLVRDTFDPAVKRAGVRLIRFHDLRHTHITLSLLAGANIRAVAARAGHSNPAFTLRVYAHALPEQDERIAQIWDGLLQPPARAATDSPQLTSPREEE